MSPADIPGTLAFVVTAKVRVTPGDCEAPDVMVVVRFATRLGSTCSTMATPLDDTTPPASAQEELMDRVTSALLMRGREGRGGW